MLAFNLGGTNPSKQTLGRLIISCCVLNTRYNSDNIQQLVMVPTKNQNGKVPRTKKIRKSSHFVLLFIFFVVGFLRSLLRPWCPLSINSN